MKKNKILSLAVFFLLLAFPLEANEHPNITEEVVMDMSKTYSYYKSQEYSLSKIQELFPEYGKQALEAQLKFDAKFKASVENIDKELSKLSDSWETVKEESFDKIKELSDFSKLTESEALQFINEVKQRADGDLQSPFLETLLIFHPANDENPALELRNGYKNAYRTKGHPKAKGVDFQIEFPKSWKNDEGLRPNIIQKFISENGRGFEGIILMVMELPVPEGYRFSDEELNEFFTPESIKDMVPKDARFIKLTPTVVEGLKSGMLYYSQRQQRLDIVLNTKTLHFLAIFGNKVITIQCYASVQGDDVSYLENRFQRMEPLFREVLNSLVIHDKWEKLSSVEEKNQVDTALDLAFGNPWWLILIVSFVLTWGIGLIPPVLIRFVFVRKPLSKGWAITLVSFFWFANIIIFTALGSKSKTHAALFLVAWVSYYILRKRPRENREKS